MGNLGVSIMIDSLIAGVLGGLAVFVVDTAFRWRQARRRRIAGQ